MDQEITEFSLNVAGLACPMPVIKLKKLLSQIQQQGYEQFQILVSFDDPGGLKDIPAFCQQAKLLCEPWGSVQNQTLPIFQFRIFMQDE